MVALCAITYYDNGNVHCVGGDVYKTFEFGVQKSNVWDSILNIKSQVINKLPVLIASIALSGHLSKVAGAF